MFFAHENTNFPLNSISHISHVFKRVRFHFRTCNGAFTGRHGAFIISQQDNKNMLSASIAVLVSRITN